MLRLVLEPFLFVHQSMTTITIHTGQTRSLRVSPGDELKIVLQENLQPAEELRYAQTSERSYHTSVPAGLSVGCKDWTVSCIDKTTIEQRLTKLEEKFDRELRDVNKKLQDLTEDSILWAELFLRNVAGEALLWAFGDQPNYQGDSRRCETLANKNDSKLAAYAAVLPLSPDPAKLGPSLDDVISRRHTLHFGTTQGLEEGVQQVVGLLTRHPDLRKQCKNEVMVIDSFADLRSIFRF